MRVLFSLGNFPPSNFGGIAHSMYSIISELNAISNFEIFVLTTNFKILPDSNIIFNKWNKYNNINVNYISTRNFPYGLRFLIEGIKKILISDKIHLSSIFFYPNFFLIIFSILVGKVVFVSPHGELLKPALRIKNWKKKPYLYFLKPFLKKCIFIVTSNLEYESVRFFYPNSKIQIIPNMFNYKPNLGINRKNQFIFIGRISKIKRIENLIQACAISNLFKINQYKLLILGPLDENEYEYKLSLDNLINHNNLGNFISFFGNIKSPEKDKLISESKCLLLVSDSENFGNVVVESLMQGTSVIASKGTPWQSLETYKCGFWVENNPEEIASKMDLIISMNDLMFNSYSKNAKIHAQDFSITNILPKWIQLFSNINYVQ